MNVGLFFVKKKTKHLLHIFKACSYTNMFVLAMDTIAVSVRPKQHLQILQLYVVLNDNNTNNNYGSQSIVCTHSSP